MKTRILILLSILLCCSCSTTQYATPINTPVQAAQSKTVSILPSTYYRLSGSSYHYVLIGVDRSYATTVIKLRSIEQLGVELGHAAYQEVTIKLIGFDGDSFLDGSTMRLYNTNSYRDADAIKTTFDYVIDPVYSTVKFKKDGSVDLNLIGTTVKGAQVYGAFRLVTNK